MDEVPQIEVLYRDERLLAVSKPAGMLVHRDSASRVFEHVLLNTVRDQVGSYLYPVHRLDRNTSGVVLFGLSSEAAREAQAALSSAEAEKAYLTLARGRTAPEFSSDRPLRNKHGEPSPALSRFETLVRFETSSLVCVRIATGRHHQIRRHLNHLGHHVVGDTTHGKGAVNRLYRAEYGLPRMFLHAWRVSIEWEGRRLTVGVGLPSDLVGVLERLGVAGSVLARVCDR